MLQPRSIQSSLGFRDKILSMDLILIISILVLAFLIVIATSGRFLLPQLLQFVKIGLPFLTKFIGL